MLSLVDLLALTDPVFVVDLTPRTMDACRAELAASPGAADAAPAGAVRGEEEHPGPPERPIRAVALVFTWEGDPVLLNIRPTLDTQMLDAMARLIRMALLTG